MLHMFRNRFTPACILGLSSLDKSGVVKEIVAVGEFGVMLMGRSYPNHILPPFTKSISSCPFQRPYVPATVSKIVFHPARYNFLSDATRPNPVERQASGDARRLENRRWPALAARCAYIFRPVPPIHAYIFPLFHRFPPLSSLYEGRKWWKGHILP
jgi:hypothetical protein